MDEFDQVLMPSPPHRLALAAMVVAFAVVAGAAATLAQWHGQQRGSVASVATTHVSTGPPAIVAQQLLADGSAIVPWPLTSAPIHLTLGQTLEIVLHRLPDERVDTLSPIALASTPPPACELTAVCGASNNVNRFAFLARRAGSFELLVDYGRRCRPSVCQNEPSYLTVVVAR